MREQYPTRLSSQCQCSQQQARKTHTGGYTLPIVSLLLPLRAIWADKQINSSVQKETSTSKRMASTTWACAFGARIWQGTRVGRARGSSGWTRLISRVASGPGACLDRKEMRQSQWAVWRPLAKQRTGLRGTQRPYWRDPLDPWTLDRPLYYVSRPQFARRLLFMNKS